MPNVFGRAFITANGKRFNTKPGATLKYGGVSREPVVGDGGVAGFQEKLEAPQVDCTIIATVDVSIAEIQAIKDGTVSFDTDHGKSYVISDAFNGPIPELSTEGIKTTFYGTEAKEA